MKPLRMKLIREDYMEMSRLLKIQSSIENKMDLLTEYSRLSKEAREKNKSRIETLEKEVEALSKELDRLKS